MLRAQNAYGGRARTYRLAAGETVSDAWPIGEAGHWYDIEIGEIGGPFLRRLAGHIETGRPSRSDPGLERA